MTECAEGDERSLTERGYPRTMRSMQSIPDCGNSRSGEMYMYRINYGNGQVFGCETLAEAKRAIAYAGKFARIQKYAGDGEWVTVCR